MVEFKRTRAAASRATSRTTIFVGLDFGTTYSGVAWARSSRPDRINIISAWGGIHYYASSDKQKAPSVISYDKNGGVSTWGYGFAPPEEPVKWFKLLLLDDTDLPERVRSSDEIVNAKRIMEKLKKEPIEVIGDYLRCLWNHTYPEIQKTMGRQFLESCQMKIIATLPAIWPAYAQVRMREALEIAGILDERPAGIPSLTFISEPEAAALASLQDCIDREDVKSGDHFVICDAGGGTVDLITYVVSRKKPVVLKESVCGDGALCGAILLDQSFKKIFPALVGYSTWAQMDPRTLHFNLFIEWENGVKRTFSGSKEPLNFILPFGASETGQQPNIKVQADQLSGIFIPVADSIVSLLKKQVTAVRQQYQKMPKAIVLVGGLGKSPFLYQYLENHGELQDIPIAQDSGERPWTAICRGAVLKGLSDSSEVSESFKIDVSSRISRYNYGTLLNTFPFEVDKDDPRDRAWCPLQGVFLAVDQVEWFLKMGTPMKETSLVKTFFQDFPEPEDDIEVELVYSANPNPPKRRETDVKQLCRIKWAKIPNFEDLPEWSNTDGAVFRRLTYEVKMTIVGSSLDFAIYYKGRRTASQNVVIEFADVHQPNKEAQGSSEQQPCGYAPMEVENQSSAPLASETQLFFDEYPMAEGYPKVENDSDSDYIP